MNMQARISNWFLKQGVRLFLHGSNIDIYKTAHLFDRDSLSKHNKRIISDLDFDQQDAFANQVISMIIACLNFDYRSQYYPKISAKNRTWLQMLGVKPTKPRFGGQLGTWLLSRKYIFQMIRQVLFKDILSSVRTARQTGTLKGTASYNKMNYLLSRNIAQKQGHDRGRNVAYLEDINIEPSIQPNFADIEVTSIIESAKLSPQESLVVQAWLSGQLPLPSNRRAHSEVKRFAKEAGLSYKGIRNIESRTKRKLKKVFLY